MLGRQADASLRDALRRLGCAAERGRHGPGVGFTSGFAKPIDELNQDFANCRLAAARGERVARAANPARPGHGPREIIHVNGGSFQRKVFSSLPGWWACWVVVGHEPNGVELAAVRPGWAKFRYSEELAWEVWGEIAAAFDPCLMLPEPLIDSHARAILAREADRFRIDASDIGRILGACLGPRDADGVRAKWLLWVVDAGPEVPRP